ncbi:unnamed protein product [Rhizophagus irregularis]|uniref:Uncharacterized protein n=1 Tax=Rhizophagus irregularis TaxID=588596 RepID=A0A915YWM3_9GLOM|nr:unnamed protein product [Rhizophagus irregularis]CAB5349354.1 unnamed protein product [Rhizophagus irregularis]
MGLRRIILHVTMNWKSMTGLKILKISLYLAKATPVHASSREHEERIFSYCNNNGYGVAMTNGTDLRIEMFQAGMAKAGYGVALAITVNPPPGFGVTDLQGNNAVPMVTNGITHYIIMETRGYEMTLNERRIMILRTQLQQSVEIEDGRHHFCDLADNF